ncbi:MAG: TonB-dependent receptor, partial [Marinirhabdus sp.]
QLIAANSLEFRPNERLQLALLSKYVGEQFMGNIDSGASKLDSYFLNDLNINYTLTSIPYFERVRFTALVNNIFNVEYVPNGYFFTFDDDFSNPGVITTVAAAGYYPAAKINYLLGVALRF